MGSFFGPVGLDKHVSLETNATTDEASSIVDVRYVDSIANDGSDDIVFNFDAPTNEDGAFTLKPGEVRGGIPKTVERLYYVAASGVQPFRFWGLR